MSSDTPNNAPNNASSQPESTGPTPLPEGYLWRLCVILVLLLGGGVCMLFYSSLIGSLMSLAGLAFGKLSGLNDMVANDRNQAS